MKIPASLQDLFDLVMEIERISMLPGSSDSVRSLLSHKYIWAWLASFDVNCISRYHLCMLDSFALAAVRGVSGDPSEVERSFLSLKVNISYYKPRIMAAMMVDTIAATPAPGSACAA
jgi:hypothetical protein